MGIVIEFQELRTRESVRKFWQFHRCPCFAASMVFCVAKTNKALASAVENTSCSSGWLRVVIQCLFCIITVASFVLILVMSIQRSPFSKNKSCGLQNCVVSNCRVICSQADFDQDYEYGLIYAISTSACKNIRLFLNRPDFRNGSFPINWLSNRRIEANIVELCIAGGNLKNIPSNTFMSSFTSHLETLSLEDITISDWKPDSLLGLLHLKELNIRDSRIVNIQKNALRAVEETLERLVIKTSGFFNPKYITGSSVLVKLDEVFFSANIFSNILGPESFCELIFCTSLQLSSSKITAIKAGTFDPMVNLRNLHLNNNLLTTLPPGIFSRIAMRSFTSLTIYLHENSWICNCQLEDLRVLNKEGFVGVDPLCNAPNRFKGLPFSKFNTFCKKRIKKDTNENDDGTNVFKKDIESGTEVIDFIDLDGKCHTNNSHYHPRAVSIHNCSYNRIKYIDSHFRNYISSNAAIVSPEFSPSFFIYSPTISIVEINMKASLDYGLIWYQSACPGEIFCVRTVPAHLRIYNVEPNASYTICPAYSSGLVRTNTCIIVDPSKKGTHKHTTFHMVRSHLFIMAIFLGGGGGAILMYCMIRKHPILLKGSKRVLIVKSKTADAIVLPPKVPLRNVSHENIYDTTGNSLYIVPSGPGLPNSLSRSSSVKSFKSSTPSYVSAIEPTEDQLKEWRQKQHHDNEAIHPLDTISWIYDGDSLYHSIHSSSDHIYETPRIFTNQRL